MGESTEKSENYEKMFAHRFTSEDAEYQEYLSRPADPPPIVEDWRGRRGGNERGRDNRYQDRRGGRGRGWGGDREGGRSWGGDREGGGRSWGGEQEGGGRSWGGDQEGGGRSWGGDREGGRGSGRGRGGDYHGHPHWHDNQSGHLSSNQGYNSHHQRPHYDRY